MLTVIKSESTETPPVELVAEWVDFWEIYPRKAAKKAALNAWAKLSNADRWNAIEGLVDWRRVWIARGEMEFVPHPATWLNGERWTDELPAEFVQRISHASHVAAEVPAAGSRTEMPAHVRAMLAKLRAGR